MKKQVFNPYLPPWEYIPDGEPRVFDDRLYIFGSHDRFGGKWFCENDYVCWSASLSDLSNWRYEGVIYRKDQDPRRGNLYAPDCVRGFDGRYYLYYSKDDTSIISVAVCDTPAGTYEYYGDVCYEDGHILGDDENEFFMFDPSVLIDGGRVWLYSGSSKRGTTTGIKRNMAGCTATELCRDMKTVKTAPQVILPGAKSWLTDAYFEGPSARRIGDTYYIVYPVRNGTGLHYATSRYPDRDFVHRGVVHSMSGVGMEGYTAFNPSYPRGNEHGGLVNLNGQWYIFNHRHTNGTGFSRQGVAEPVTIDEDGTILQAEATSCGLNGGPLCEEDVYPAYIACHLTGGRLFGVRLPKLFPKITQSGADGDENADFYISGMKNGSVAGYRYFAFTGGRYEITLTLRGDGGSVETAVSPSDAAVGTAGFEESAVWQKVTVKAQLPPGKAGLYFTYRGKGSVDILSFQIKKSEE